MPRSLLLIHSSTILIAGFLTVGISRAADADPGKTAAKLMLDKGWAKTKAARDIVNQQNLKDPPLKDDSRVRAAHWLVLMFQGQRGLALDSIKLFLEKHPASIDPLRAEVWMRMVDRDYEKALATAVRLAVVVAPQQGGEKEATASAASSDVVWFLGRVAGFLEGPAGKANDVQLQKFEAQILARLSDAQKKEFQSARKDVLDQFRRIQQQVAGFKAGAQQAANDAKQDKSGNFNDKGYQLSKDKEKSEADAKKIDDDLQRKMADLERQDQRLQDEWKGLKNQSEQLNNFIQQQEDQLKRLEQNAADSKNPQQQDARNAARVAHDQLRETKSRLKFTNEEIYRVEAAHKRLLEQGLRNQWQAQIEGQQVQGQKNQLKQEMRKNAADQRRAETAKDAAAADAHGLEERAIALEADSRAFATYDNFPFQEVRTKLLRALR